MIAGSSFNAVRCGAGFLSGTVVDGLPVPAAENWVTTSCSTGGSAVFVVLQQEFSIYKVVFGENTGACTLFSV